MKLTNEQELVIQRLKVDYDNYKAQLDFLKRKYALDVAELKQPIVAAVGAAIAAGIPVRQVHQRGLGMQAVNQLQAFLTPVSETVGTVEKIKTIASVGVQTREQLDAALPLVTTIVELGSDDWELRDEDQTTHKFHDYNFDGYHIIKFKDTEFEDITPMMKRQIFDKWPDGVIGFDQREDRFGKTYEDRGETL
jgi:hypothetical protein